MLEQELKKIYRFFVQQERELYLKINLRLHARKRYEVFPMIQVDKELDELQSLSNFSTSISSFVYINITGMYKILKKFDKKFKRYNLNFTRKFIIEKYNKKNSDLLYINQYKILDEVGALVEQLKYELQEQYYYLIKNPIKEANNTRTNSLSMRINEELNGKEDGGLFEEDKAEEVLLTTDEGKDKEIDKENNEILNISNDTNGTIKDKFNTLQESISTMEAFYHETNKVFNIWKRYLKENDYKSGIYSVKSAGVIDSDSDEKDDKDKKAETKHYLSKESYWNIRIVLVQALIMSICSYYIMPTIYYCLKLESFMSNIFDNNERRGFLCGIVIAMSPIGGLFSMFYSYYIVKKSYKIPMILSSILSIIGNILFILGVANAYISLILIGRLITGFSLNTPVHRKYLLYFIPKRRMSKYLLYFKLTVFLGNFLGPVLSFFCLYSDNLGEKKYINDYTLPGWICFTASLALLFIIVILFSEPLNPNFIIYAEGQAPTEIMKKGGAFSIDNNLTIYEAEKLNEINQKVSNFNDENQFNDTNLVSATIKELIEYEMEPYGTVRKAFLVIVSYVFILSFAKYSYITIAPAYLYAKIKDEEEDSNIEDLKIITILYSISLLLIIPTFLLNFFYISMRINQIFYIKVASLVFLILELLTTFFVIEDTKYEFFYFSFLLTILIAYMVEDQIIYFYTHIIPTNFKICKIQGLTVLHITQYLGYIIGSASSLFEFVLKEEKKELDNIEIFMTIQNSFLIFVQLVLLVIFFIYSNSFSERPIRRILYSKNKREIKTTEF